MAPSGYQIANYAIIAGCFAFGANALSNPIAESARFGLPPGDDPKTAGKDVTRAPSNKEAVKSLVYLKGIRESSYATILLALQ